MFILQYLCPMLCLSLWHLVAQVNVKTEVVFAVVAATSCVYIYSVEKNYASFCSIVNEMLFGDFLESSQSSYCCFYFEKVLLCL